MRACASVLLGLSGSFFAGHPTAPVYRGALRWVGGWVRSRPRRGDHRYSPEISATRSARGPRRRYGGQIRVQAAQRCAARRAGRRDFCSQLRTTDPWRGPGRLPGPRAVFPEHLPDRCASEPLPTGLRPDRRSGGGRAVLPPIDRLWRRQNARADVAVRRQGNPLAGLRRA